MSLEEKLKTEKHPEDKVRIAIDEMRELLSKSGKLKEFWEAKRLCMEAFKEQMHPVKRAALWSDYIGLVDEARRLKEIYDEQATFAIEQIELAAKAVESDLERYDELVKKVPDLAFPRKPYPLKKKERKYNGMQRELNFLGILASKLDSLRKETLQTEMRIREKNRLLQAISRLGDLVFPKRKELIKMISDEFLEDVTAFVEEKFKDGKPTDEFPVYALLNDVRHLQHVGKLLTLNTGTFNKCRKKLSGCWDLLKVEENSLKEEESKKEEEFKDQYEAFKLRVEEVTKLSQDEKLEAAEKLILELKTLELSKKQ